MNRISPVCDTKTHYRSTANWNYSMSCHTRSEETTHRRVSIRWHRRENYKYRPDYRHDGRILSVRSQLDDGGMADQSISQAHSWISSLWFGFSCYVLEAREIAKVSLLMPCLSFKYDIWLQIWRKKNNCPVENQLPFEMLPLVAYPLCR